MGYKMHSHTEDMKSCDSVTVVIPSPLGGEGVNGTAVSDYDINHKPIIIKLIAV